MIISENPLVSVIIPIYNVEKYLEQCLLSIIHQSYKNLEIILINDGSPDGCKEICNKYAKIDTRIILINQLNGGLSVARNSGIGIARGEYFLFVDSDDWVSIEEVECLVKLAVSNNALVATGSYERVHDGLEPKKKDRDNKIVIRKGCEYVRLMARPFGVFCFACNRLVHRSLLDGYRFPPGYIFEDIFVMPRVIYNCNKVVSTSKILYYYRIRNTSLSHRKFTLEALHEMDAYINLFSFGEDKNDKKIKLYAALFFVTKYHYYTLKVLANHLGINDYRIKYKAFAKKCWKYIFSYLFF